MPDQILNPASMGSDRKALNSTMQTHGRLTCCTNRLSNLIKSASARWHLLMLNHSRSSRVAIPSPPTRHGAEEQESYLLRLPVEIQIQICELVYEDVIVHILLRDKRLTHFVCPLRNPIHDKEGLRGAPVYLYEQCCCLGSALMPAFKKPPKMHDVRKSREVGRKRLSTRLSGLFFTCKQL